MKKNIKKLVWLMIKIKLICLVIILGLSSVNAEVWSQNNRIDLKVEECSLNQIVKMLQKKTDMKFVYNLEDLSKYSAKGDFKDMTVNEILDIVLNGTSLKYEEMNNYIIISKLKTKSEQQKVIKIKGVVKDLKGQPLTGATVFIKGTSIGVATDIDGKFELSVNDEKAVIVFSFIGMKTKELVVGKQRELKIVLEDDTAQLEEMVVTGYFDRSKNSFTGAVKQVKREELTKFGNVTLLEALSLVDPSFKMKENNIKGSDPNTLPDFFVRGEGSFMGSNVPTFIVDGYEVNVQQVFDMDMDRIKSISILKDASATVFYGARAANGVVVIETRRPTAGDLKVSFSNKTSISIADLTDYDLMNASNKLDYEISTGLYDDSDPNRFLEKQIYMNKIKADIARGVNTDWLAQPTRNGLSTINSLYVYGGDEKVTYGVNLNYSNNQGVIKKSGRENYGATFDLTYRIPGKVSIRNSFSYNETNIKNSPYGSYSQYAKANPYFPIYDANRNIIRFYNAHPGGSYSGSLYPNPLYNASLPYRDEGNIQRITNNFSLDYNILKNLRFKGAFSVSKGIEKNDKYISPNNISFMNITDVNEKGSYTQTNGNSSNYNINATLNYSLNIEGHQFFSGLGINVNQKRSYSSTVVGTGYLDERFNEIGFASTYKKGGKPTGNGSISRMVGFLGTVNYSYNNRYFADFSTRIDGSSKYGKDTRFAPLWSLGFGWNLHSEEFLKGNSLISRLTLRSSIGTTGSQNFSENQAKTMMKYYNDKLYYGALGALFSSFGNDKLEWQRTFKRNIGLNLDFIQRRLVFSFDYYSDITEGLLLPVTVSPSHGFSSYTENYGEQSNKGYEFSISGVIIRNKEFDWSMYINGVHNINRIEKISNSLQSYNEQINVEGDQTKPIALYEEGESLSSIKAVPSLGINPATGNELFLDRFGNITEEWDYRDKIKVGDESPLIEGTIGTNLIWKQLSMNMQFRYSYGSQIYNSTLSDRIEGANPYYNADRRVWDERWKKPGDRTFYKRIDDRSVANATSRFVEDNNFVQLSNVSIAYKINPELISNLGISNMRVAFNSGNLFYWSTSKRERGLDYPFARQFTLSLNLNF